MFGPLMFILLMISSIMLFLLITLLVMYGITH